MIFVLEDNMFTNELLYHLTNRKAESGSTHRNLN